jgi:hypothetical protein
MKTLNPFKKTLGGTSFGAALVAVVVPKCPLCVATYMAGFGLSASAAQATAPYVRPIALGLAILSLAGLALGMWHTRKQRDDEQPSCCSHLGSG